MSTQRSTLSHCLWLEQAKCLGSMLFVCLQFLLFSWQSHYQLFFVFLFSAMQLVVISCNRIIYYQLYEHTRHRMPGKSSAPWFSRWILDLVFIWFLLKSGCLQILDLVFVWFGLKSVYLQINNSQWIIWPHHFESYKHTKAKYAISLFMYNWKLIVIL